MARYTGAVCRVCRREGQKLFLKGDRCYTGKCGFARRPNPPGIHGRMRKKYSEYGLQLRAKQKTKHYYGILEKQFRHYYERAKRLKEGKAGENILMLLELRLDNVVYRLGWASSRAEARQLVNHGHFAVNGRRVDFPAFSVSVGDVISICEKSRPLEKFKINLEANSSRAVVKWLEYNRAADVNVAKVVAKPLREDIDLDVEETLIIELYSK